MYSSMPRSSKEAWCSEGCGPRAIAMLWCQALIRMNHIISPMRGCISVSDRANARCFS